MSFKLPWERLNSTTFNIKSKQFLRRMPQTNAELTTLALKICSEMNPFMHILLKLGQVKRDFLEEIIFFIRQKELGNWACFRFNIASFPLESILRLLFWPQSPRGILITSFITCCVYKQILGVQQKSVYSTPYDIMVVIRGLLRERLFILPTSVASVGKAFIGTNKLPSS